MYRIAIRKVILCQHESCPVAATFPHSTCCSLYAHKLRVRCLITRARGSFWRGHNNKRLHRRFSLSPAIIYIEVRACNFTCTPAAATANHSRSQPQRIRFCPLRRFYIFIQLPSRHYILPASHQHARVSGISSNRSRKITRPLTFPARRQWARPLFFFADLIYNTHRILSINAILFSRCVQIMRLCGGARCILCARECNWWRASDLWPGGVRHPVKIAIFFNWPKERAQTHNRRQCKPWMRRELAAAAR